MVKDEGAEHEHVYNQLDQRRRIRSNRAASAPQPAPQRAPAEPCLFVIMGATGDLMSRKLLPALYRLRRRGLLPDHSALLGVAVETNLDDDSFREKARKALIDSGIPSR